LSQKIPTGDWDSAPDNLSQNGLNYPTYDVTHKKNKIQNI